MVLIKQKSDPFFMQEALKEAEKAAEIDEVPVGAIVVDGTGKVVARAYNQTIKKKSPLGHAEILVLVKAAKKLDDWRLDGCTLYVTLEPCAMCMQLIMMGRIDRLVYGADSPIYGFSQDTYCTFDVSDMPLVIKKGVEKDASQKLLKQFFKEKRRRFDGTKDFKKGRARKN